MKYLILLFVLIPNLLLAQSNRNFWFTIGDGKQANALYISEVPGFKADLERLCGIPLTNNAGQWQATNTQRPFTAADNGKLLVVKNAWPTGLHHLPLTP